MRRHFLRCFIGAPPLVPFFLSLVVWLHTSDVAGQESAPLLEQEEPVQPEVVEAREHFSLAVTLFHEGNLEAALAEFQESYRLNPLPQVLYNIAVVQRDLDRYEEAVETLQQYIEESEEEPDRRRAVARELLIELEGLLATVYVDCEQTGANLYVDGLPTGQTPLDEPLRISEGLHEFELRLEGFETYHRSLELLSGQVLDLDVELSAIQTPFYRTWWFWTSVGGGVAVITIIAVLAAVLSRPESAQFDIRVVSAEAQ